jgi:hypothetical protein
MSDLSRCLRRVPVTYDQLAAVLTGGFRFHVKLGLPMDAQIVSVFSNDDRKEIYAVVRSSSYSPISRAEVIYETNPPIFEQIRHA